MYTFGWKVGGRNKYALSVCNDVPGVSWTNDQAKAKTWPTMTDLFRFILSSRCMELNKDWGDVKVFKVAEVVQVQPEEV